MAIILKVADWEWPLICECLQTIAPACKTAPHYIWFVGHATEHHDRDLQRLVEQLGLEDQFAEVEPDDPAVSDFIIDLLETDGPELLLSQTNCVVVNWPSAVLARP